METQKMTRTGVHEIGAGRPATTAPGEAAQTPEQEFAQIFAQMLTGRELGEVNAFDALRLAPELSVAEVRPEQSSRMEEKEVEVKDSEELDFVDEDADESAKLKSDGLKVEATVVTAQTDKIVVDTAEEKAEIPTPVAPKERQVNDVVQNVNRLEQEFTAKAAETQQAVANDSDLQTRSRRQAVQNENRPVAVKDPSAASEGASQKQDVQDAVDNTQEAVKSGKTVVKSLTESGVKGLTEQVQSSSLSPETEAPKAQSAKSAAAGGVAGADIAKAGVAVQGAALQASVAEAAKTTVQAQGGNALVNALGSAEESSKRSTPASKESAKSAATQRTQIAEQIQKLLDAAAKSKDGNTMVVRLDPPDLGTLTVKITRRADQIFARIVPESPEVEQLLRERASEMTQVLASQGFRTENVQISIGVERSESESFCFDQFGFDRSNADSGDQANSDSPVRREVEEQTVLASIGTTPGLSEALDYGWVA